MLTDLQNPNSVLRKGVLSVEEAAAAAQKLKNEIALAEANAKITTATAAQTRAENTVNTVKTT
jgi:hypothetical protein